jgi:UDP-N-acetylglucosamine diphosphorylase/glucosamine-1-phosphate N-acetyltransferase
MVTVLFEDNQWKAFLPLVFTRPVGEIRIGIYTIAEKWSKSLNCEVSHRTREHLRELFPGSKEKDVLLINARVMPTPDLIECISALSQGQALLGNGQLIAMRASSDEEEEYQIASEFNGEIFMLEKVTDIFSKNGKAIELDLPLWQAENTCQPIHESNTIIGDPNRVFLAEGAKVYASILNTLDGPIILCKDAEIMEGSMVRGGLVLGEHSALKMGAKIYGPSTFGPHCKVGGEVSNSVIFGYSNKGHDGFIGNTVMGEWCNLGADTNTSNLKNNYSLVKIWNYELNNYGDTGLTFCGLIMGDHSKSGINTMFNTGTVVGVCANIFGAAFPEKHIPNFSWGGADGFEPYQLDKACETAQRMMARRNIEFTDAHRRLFSALQTN